MDPIETGTNQNKQENQHPNEQKMGIYLGQHLIRYCGSK